MYIFVVVNFTVSYVLAKTAKKKSGLLSRISFIQNLLHREFSKILRMGVIGIFRTLSDICDGALLRK